MNDVKNKLKVPGIGLIISGIFNGLTGAVFLISGIIRFSGIGGKENLPNETAELAGYLFATFGVYGIGFLSMVASPIIIFGGVRLLKGQSRGLVIFSAVLSILPVTSCCFLISLIFGVWALVVLRDTQVKMFFQNGGKVEGMNSSTFPPPPNW